MDLRLDILSAAIESIAVRPTGWLLALILSTGACQPGQPSLAGTQPSQAALAEAVLDALARQDESALHQLALSESEFRDLVWPELPAARPERNLPFSYVWQDLRQKSEVSLRRTLAEHGGKRYQLVAIRFRGETTSYRTFAVHRDSIATIVDASGVQKEVALFGSALARNGRLKVFSYVVDN